jgi:nucleotide-binding universal stress UspA family protein
MRPILVATDFTIASKPAMRVALFLAKRTGARLIFLHVAYFSEVKSQFGMSYEMAHDMALDQARTELKADVEVLLKSAGEDFSKLKPEIKVRFSASPSDAILELAAQKKVSLIVLGTHGAKGMNKVVFGSNAAHVIASGKFIVLAVPPKSKISDPETLYYSTDLTKFSAEFNKVKQFAEKTALEAQVVFIDYGWARSKEEEKEYKKLSKQGVPVSNIGSKLNISLHESLRTFMKEKNNSILCLFHQRKSGIATFLFGSTSESLSMASDFPLLVFPK